jgi:hypothetical protein
MNGRHCYAARPGWHVHVPPSVGTCCSGQALRPARRRTLSSQLVHYGGSLAPRCCDMPQMRQECSVRHRQLRCARHTRRPLDTTQPWRFSAVSCSGSGARFWPSGVTRSRRAVRVQYYGTNRASKSPLSQHQRAGVICRRTQHLICLLQYIKYLEVTHERISLERRGSGAAHAILSDGGKGCPYAVPYRRLESWKGVQISGCTGCCALATPWRQCSTQQQMR